ncbi:MAG: competence protein ComEC [Planctomycetota bacterium]
MRAGRGTGPRRFPTHFLLPLLVGLVACTRASYRTDPPEDPQASKAVQAVRGRWEPRGHSRSDTRGGVGVYLATFQLARGSVAADEAVCVLSTQGRVLRAQPPAFARPTLTYARHPDIAWIRVPPDDLVRTGRARPSLLAGWRAWISDARQAGLLRARRLRSKAARNLYGALLFGERGTWSASAADLFTRTGTRHVLSLSGLHVGLLSWMVAQPLGALLAWGLNALMGVIGLRWRVSPVAPQAILVWLFVPLAGGNPPVVRAAWALTLAQFARWVPTTGQRRGRRPQALHLWAFALLLECLADPGSPAHLGVQLSYAATLGLVLGYAGARRLGMGLWNRLLPLHATSVTGHPRAPWWRIPVRKLSDLLVSSTAASFVAIVATLPMTWCNFGEWSPWGLIAMPLVLPPLILFMGCASLWTLLPFDGLQAWVELAGQALLALLGALDGLPGTPTQLPPRPFLWLATLACALLWLIAHSGAATRVSCCVSRVVAIGLGLTWLPWTTAARSLEIVLLEVGHGTALVLRAPGEACWIFDAGSRDRPSIARSAIAPLLREWEIAEVHVVVSHDHRDHTSGLPWLSGRWTPGLWAGSQVTGLDVRARVDLKHGRTQLPTHTDALRIDLLRGQDIAGNEGSRSLEVMWGAERSLLCGDAEAAGLARLLRDGELQGPVRLLLLPHHGSDGRETEALLTRVMPREVWISRASQVPIEETLDRMELSWFSTEHGPLSLILPTPTDAQASARETDG